MALYIDSAFLDDITRVAQTVLVAGVTTNPSIMLAAQERGQTLSPRETLNELLHNEQCSTRILTASIKSPGETIVPRLAGRPKPNNIAPSKSRHIFAIFASLMKRRTEVVSKVFDVAGDHAETRGTPAEPQFR